MVALTLEKTLKSEFKEEETRSYSAAELRRKMAFQMADIVSHYINLNYYKNNSVSFSQAFNDWANNEFLRFKETLRIEYNRDKINKVCDSMCGKDTCQAHLEYPIQILKDDIRVIDPLKDDTSTRVWYCSRLSNQQMYDLLKID